MYLKFETETEKILKVVLGLTDDGVFIYTSCDLKEG